MSDDSQQGNKPDDPKKLRLTFAPGELEGHYVNLAMTTHGPTEFVLDFAFVPPGLREAKVLSRVIVSPVNLKRFARVLEENIRRYESRFGTIDIKIGGPEPTLH